MPDEISKNIEWHKTAVIYELYVRGFQDSNRDGRGDFRGLISRLDYLVDLGIDCLWLMPIYPSPGRDDGYDIMDYYGVNPEYGTVEDFRNLLYEAHNRGLRVLGELVLNHTSGSTSGFSRRRRGPPRPISIITCGPTIPTGTVKRALSSRMSKCPTGLIAGKMDYTTGTAFSTTSPTSTTKIPGCAKR